MKKNKDMFIISCIIYYYLIYVTIFEKKLNNFELLTVSTGLLTVLTFLKNIIYNDKNIDFIHLVYCYYAFFTPLFIENINLLFLFELIILINLTYWLVDGKCPVGGYKNENIKKITSNFNFVPWISLAVVSYKIYHRLSY